MNKFLELQTFIEITESGGISKAAERLAVAKSAVSRRLTSLESRLGIELFHRTTRSMKLTESGRSLYQHANRILADLEEVEDSLSQSNSELSGTIKAAAPLSFGLEHLAPVIIEFNKQHPKINFELDFNDRQIDLVHEGFDLTLRISNPEDSSLIARHITQLNFVLCASPNYLKRFGTPTTPNELEQHSCLLYNLARQPNAWSLTDKKNKRYQIKATNSLKANNGNFLKNAAIADAGIALLPNFIVYKAIQQQQLLPILTEYILATSDLWAVYSQTRHLSHRVRTFINFLIERFQKTPY